MIGIDPALVINMGRLFKSRLDGLYPENELETMAWITATHLLNQERVKLLADPKSRWPAKEYDEVQLVISRLANQEPLQYILGVTEFCGHQFQVKPGVLIPRGETEELVHWISNELNQKAVSNQFKLLDIGCGSGAIGISLAKSFPEIQVYCTDAYQIPLDVSTTNASELNVHVQVNHLDILNPASHWLSEKFDLIVSNPPYVTPDQREKMQPQVVDYEPETALFVDDQQPLVFYQAIAEFAAKTLKKNGQLFLEINEDLGQETLLLIQQYFSSAELRIDIHGKPRMIKAQHGD